MRSGEGHARRATTCRRAARTALAPRLMAVSVSACKLGSGGHSAGTLRLCGPTGYLLRHRRQRHPDGVGRLRLVPARDRCPPAGSARSGNDPQRTPSAMTALLATLLIVTLPAQRVARLQFFTRLVSNSVGNTSSHCVAAYLPPTEQLRPCASRLDDECQRSCSVTSVFQWGGAFHRRA
jgi:hypothetical protein